MFWPMLSSFRSRFRPTEAFLNFVPASTAARRTLPHCLITEDEMVRTSGPDNGETTMATFTDNDNFLGLFEDETFDASSLGNSNDRFNLGRGNDTAIGGAGNDVFFDGGIDGDGYEDTGRDTMLGGTGNDTFNVTDDNNVIDGGDGIDTISFSAYAHDGIVNPINQNQGVSVNLLNNSNIVSVENLTGSNLYDRLSGSDVANTINGLAGNDTIDGRGGNDTLRGDAGRDVMSGGTGNDWVYGGSENDTISGDSGADRLWGDAGSDVIAGGTGNDVLNGGLNDDRLTGGSGADQMTGGTGADVFVFAAASESNGLGATDRITDFTHGVDRIDLSAIDASFLGFGNNAFNFIGSADFSSAFGRATPGQLRASYDAASNTTVIEGNTDIDFAAEFTLNLTGNVGLTAIDFVL
jgi:Ca2+-binding RTX toxin-like protein